MINTRDSIYHTLKRALNKLTKLAQYNSKTFKDIIYAIIINDLKEWAEYIPTKDGAYLVDLLERYLLCHSEFQIEKFLDVDYYTNTNTPQDNTTWRKISVIDGKKITVSENRTWSPDSSCTPQIIYVQGDPRDKSSDTGFTPGKYALDYSKLTTCDKMNVYIDVTTGNAWYLDYSGNWKAVVDTTGGVSEQRVIDLIKEKRGQVEVSTNENIELNVVDSSTNKKINLADVSKIEELL